MFWTWIWICATVFIIMILTNLTSLNWHAKHTVVQAVFPLNRIVTASSQSGLFCHAKQGHIIWDVFAHFSISTHFCLFWKKICWKFDQPVCCCCCCNPISGQLHLTLLRVTDTVLNNIYINPNAVDRYWWHVNMSHDTCHV